MKMLCLFDHFLHFYWQHLALAVTFLCGKIRILPIIWENYRKYYRKPIYRHFSNYRQIIDIEIRLPEIIGNIWRNYRYRYRYRNWQENYRKIIVIEKNDLSLTPTHRPSNQPYNYRLRCNICLRQRYFVWDLVSECLRVKHFTGDAGKARISCDCRLLRHPLKLSITRGWGVQVYEIFENCHFSTR